MEKQRLKFLIIVCAVTGFMLYMYGQIDYNNSEFSEMDFHSYWAMAKAAPEISENIIRPFAFRILGPYVVGMLPLTETQGFYVFTLLAAVSLAGVFYLFLCFFKIEPPVAALSTILFVMNKYFFGQVVWDYFQVNDILSFIYIPVLFWSMLKGNWKVFSVTMLLGTLTRETYMLMIPVAFFYLFEKKKLGTDAARLLAALIPALVSFILLRWLIHPAGGEDLVQAFLLYSRKLLSPVNWFRLLVNAFIPLSLLPVIFLGKTVSFFRDKKYAVFYLLLVFVSSLFGVDNERLMAPSFVIYYLLVAMIIQEYFSKQAAMLAILLACTFLSSFHHFIGRFLLPRDLTVLLSIGSLLVVSAAAFLYKRRAVKLTVN